MDVFPKYIIEDGNLIIGKCTFHRELVEKDSKKVIGGGWFDYNKDDNSFTFYGVSTDFGGAMLENVKKAVEDKKVFTRSMIRNISDKHNFFYKHVWGEIVPLI